MNRRLALQGLMALLLGMTSSAAAELGNGQGDFGGIGLMQTPTARMGELGHFAAGWNRTSPYRRYSVFVQPTDWLEAGFRYVSVENRDFAAAEGDRNNLDKGIDAKFRLREESRYWPQLALGLRDLGGTTLFGAEYLVASKRWHQLDFTLGLGWGYLGNNSDSDSPLAWLDDRFERRPSDAGGDQGGEFALGQLFRGPVALFGGVEYQTPWEPLVLQMEVEGNDYANEPQQNDQVRDSRLNFGARYHLTDTISLRAGWQRGNTAMLGVSLATNLAGLSQVKRDPPPQPLDAPAADDWPAVADLLQENAGIRVAELHRDGGDLTVVGEPMRFRNLARSENRASRILNAKASDAVNTFRYRWQARGLDLREDVHDRSAFTAAATSRSAEPLHRYGIYAHAKLEAPAGDRLYRAKPQRFTWQLGPAIAQNFGGPDGYLYRVSATASGELTTDANGWFSGNLNATLADNLDNYTYIADSELPRVRTFIGDYLAQTDVGIGNLQYTRTTKFGDDIFAMGYAGLLEMMYAGVGGELLYRPFNSPLALGADLNWVRQRDFDQQFGLRDYDVWTGHLSAYLDTGIEDVLAKLSVGRYLAGDIGTTLDFSREFDNGVRVGAWATFTDAGDAFGEGSFDKALYLSIPMDAFFTRSSRDRAEIAWQPLTRDGGARLNRRYELNELTQERTLGRYWKDYETSWE